MLALVPWRTPARTAVMRALSWIGSGAFEIPFGLLSCSWPARRAGRRRAAAFYAWVVLSGWALKLLAKDIDRAGQAPRHTEARGWRRVVFVSHQGHAMLAPLVFGLAAVLAARHCTTRLARGARCWAAPSR